MENLKYTEILQFNKSLTGKILSKAYNIGVLANVTVNSFKEILEYSCRVNNIEPNIEIGNFDNIVQDSSKFYQKDLLIIFYDTLNIIDNIDGYFEDLTEESYINYKQKIITELSIIFENLKSTTAVIFNTFSDAYYPSSILVSLKVSLFVEELNKYLIDFAPSNFTIVNIDKIYSKVGIQQCIDKRFYLSSKAPYTLKFFKAYVSFIENLILKNNGKLKKALIFDCDNTLWKGIIGEDGIENIEMSPLAIPGMFFSQIQQLAVYLSKKGVIIGLCSKNNEADVQEVLKNHKDMVLKEENIVISKINWGDKASNLRAIARELNISLDSLVFIDDSSFEINLIKEQLPEVLSLQVPANIAEYPEFILNNIYKYFNLLPNKDDIQKTQMYKAQFQRETDKNAFNSIEDYLASLAIEVEIITDDLLQIPRIAQLTQKTNQFNLTTFRYTDNQIEQFMKSNNHYVFAMFVKDKFGDNGLTGVCIVKEDDYDSKKMIIDTLLMSCRIIGRNIEYAFINTIINKLSSLGYVSLIANYIPTSKNIQVAEFYDNLGFKLEKELEDLKQYSLNINNYTPKQNEYVKVSNRLK